MTIVSHNKIAIVTGGTRGIGSSISQKLQQMGYTVIANFMGNDTAAQAFHEQTNIIVKKWDASDYEASEKALKEILAQYGTVSVLVNNAGITRDNMFHKMELKQWQEVMDVNLNSLFNVTHPIIEPMRAQGYGRIVNIASINGQKGQLGQVNYSAAKAGVIGFTKALAQESARKGITVNCVAPGYIETDMTKAMPENAREKIVATIPTGRLGYAQEIARCIAYLVGPDSDFINGETIAVNGAQYIS